MLGADGANALALALTAVANTAANRRVTFGLRGREGLARQHALGALVYVITLGLTDGALGVLHGLAPGAPRGVEVAVLVVAGFAATVTRYVALKTYVFVARRRDVLPVARPAVSAVDPAAAARAAAASRVQAGLASSAATDA
jgi:putative flippase GtrA